MRPMCFYMVFFVFLFSTGAWAQAQDSTQGTPLSPAAQKLIQLQKAGVDEPTLLAYVQNSPTGFDLTADGVLALKAGGVPSTVISAALKREPATQVTQVPAATDKVEEWDLFRLAYGRIYYKSKVYFLQDGLDPFLQQTILSDPATHSYMKDYQDLRNTSGILTWGGLGLLVGGAVCGAVTSAQSDQQGWATGISLGAMGAGLVMTIVGTFTDRASFQTLFNGMTQYNQDLVLGQTRR